MKAVTNLSGTIIAVKCDCGFEFWPVHTEGYRCFRCGKKVPRKILEKIKYQERLK